MIQYNEASFLTPPEIMSSAALNTCSAASVIYIWVYSSCANMSLVFTPAMFDQDRPQYTHLM